MKKGQAYIFNVPPGWLFTGIYNEEKDNHLLFDQVVWLENTQEPVFNLCRDVRAGRVDKIITRCTPLLGYELHHDFLAFATEIPEGVAKTLFGKNATDAIKATK
jgi:hypothetical protein